MESISFHFILPTNQMEAVEVSMDAVGVGI